MSARTPQIQVVPHEGRWALQQGGKVLSTHDTREAAVDAARQQAPGGQADVVVHDSDGQVAGEGRPPKGEPDIPS